MLGVEGMQFHLCCVKPRMELDSQNDLHRSVSLCSCLTLYSTGEAAHQHLQFYTTLEFRLCQCLGLGVVGVQFHLCCVKSRQWLDSHDGLH